MAHAPINTQNVKGRFQESNYGHVFEYIDAPSPVSHNGKVFDKMIFVGPHFQETTRYAIILKTVAYIIRGENSKGYVVEKWKIKNKKVYPS